MDEVDAHQPATRRSWITRGVLGIVLATFLSDFSHEMVTAVLPLYLMSIGLGPAALGLIEGLADFLVSMSKLGGGVAGHHLERKRPVASLAYLITTLATSSIALVHSVAGLVSLRSIAWMARGFRGPLRDFLLSDAVQPTHYGRAYGLERAGDMLGAVSGPLVATLLVWLGFEFRTLILWALAPGVLAAAAFFFLTKEKARIVPDGIEASLKSRQKIPRVFWCFLGGVLLFGIGDFSRTFLILIAANGLGENHPHAEGAPRMISVAILLYAMHNAVSALAAFPIGHLGDRHSKRKILVGGYVLGVITNLLLALLGYSIGWIVVAIALSGIYIAVEETIEKAAAAEMLPRELRSLGFGILAFANAIGDMASSMYVGVLLQNGHAPLAFGLAAFFGSTGVVWLVVLTLKSSRSGAVTQANGQTGVTSG